MSDELLNKMPRFALFTSEFCFIADDSEAFAERAKKCGKLLDISMAPGAAHTLEAEEQDSDIMKQFWEDQLITFEMLIRDKK